MEDFKDATKRIEILQNFTRALAMEQNYPKNTCSTVAARIILNGLLCNYLANDDYIL